MAGDLPGAVLFACSKNAVRSPMAEGLMRHLYGHKIYVASCGVRTEELDPFAVTVMEDLGIDMLDIGLPGMSGYEVLNSTFHKTAATH